MIIKLLVEGGSMKPGPALAQQLGPMGINMGKVISDINTATEGYKGLTLPVNLDVDPKTKKFSIQVLSPPVSALIKKEAGIELASGERKKNIVGNIALEQLISVTKAKQPNMLAKEFVSALKSVIGSCMSMGVIIDNKDPKEVLREISEGKYDKEIKSQSTAVSEEKKRSLAAHFTQIQYAQAKAKKEAEEKAAADEAAKAAAATAKPAEGAAAAPAEAGKAAAAPGTAVPAAAAGKSAESKSAKPAAAKAAKK